MMQHDDDDEEEEEEEEEEKGIVVFSFPSLIHLQIQPTKKW